MSIVTPTLFAYHSFREVEQSFALELNRIFLQIVAHLSEDGAVHTILGITVSDFRQDSNGRGSWNTHVQRVVEAQALIEA